MWALWFLNRTKQKIFVLVAFGATFARTYLKVGIAHILCNLTWIIKHIRDNYTYPWPYSVGERAKSSPRLLKCKQSVSYKSYEAVISRLCVFWYGNWRHLRLMAQGSNRQKTDSAPSVWSSKTILSSFSINASIKSKPFKTHLNDNK